MGRTVRALPVAAALISCLSWQHGLAAGQRFTARLDTVPIDRQTQATVTGNGSATAVVDGSRVVIDGVFEGLSGPATEAWLHIGPATGARGPTNHELDVTRADHGSIHATFRLDQESLAALEAGHLYIQIHSEAAPEGNLWGWLLPEE